MTEIQTALFAMQDEKYGDFQQKLIPGLPREKVIGVRTPQIKTLAKELRTQNLYAPFLASLPHEYYDENILHGAIISLEKDYDTCIRALNVFLPYVDNWAVCDLLSPKILGKHKDILLPQILNWVSSPHLYTCRFGIEMLMTFYLDEDFTPEILEIPAAIHSEEYYLNMMLAWFYATALAKQWDAAIPYLSEHRLSPWVHNKTIQKAIESYRITPEQKEYLRTLKIK